MAKVIWVFVVLVVGILCFTSELLTWWLTFEQLDVRKDKICLELLFEILP